MLHATNFELVLGYCLVNAMIIVKKMFSLIDKDPCYYHFVEKCWNNYALFLNNIVVKIESYRNPRHTQ